MDSSLGSGFHILLHVGEVHIAVAVYATGHLHGIAGDGLREVLVDHLPVRGIAQVFADGGAGTEFEVGILCVVDVLFQGLILIQVPVVVVVGLALFELFLCHCRGRKAGKEHDDAEFFHV